MGPQIYSKLLFVNAFRYKKRHKRGLNSLLLNAFSYKTDPKSTLNSLFLNTFSYKHVTNVNLNVLCLNAFSYKTDLMLRTIADGGKLGCNPKP